jgi:hypothetical protein
MEIVNCKTLLELNALEETWERLSKQEPIFVPSFSELRAQFELLGSNFRILVAVENFKVLAIACFAYRQGIKRYSIGERKLFDLPVKELELFGSCVLGQAGECVIVKLFKSIKEEANFDLVNVGEIEIDSPLYKAVTNFLGGLVWRATRRNTIRWLIKLPRSFDDYVKSLGTATRKNDVRHFKKFERELASELHIIQRPEQVETFLRDGESISRKTYQWNVGQRLCNDGATRHGFMRLAKEGRLRAYIVYMDKKPCAFAWGEVNHNIYLSNNTGFDPEYRKASPGTAIMLWVIRDLIENTDCKFFDFGTGGDNMNFKSRYGNTSLNVASIQLANYRPYSFVLYLLDEMINGGKNLANAIISQGNFRQRLKRAIRQYGEKKPSLP